MKNGKYSSKKGLNMKPLALLLALALVVGGVVGGTIAWLTAQTGPVVNTFTVGDVNIGLTEDVPNSFDFVPGDKQEKDPKVSVTAGSEACYLFVKVTVDNNFATDNMGTDATTDDLTVNPVVNFGINSGWTYIQEGIAQSDVPTQFVDGEYYFYRTVDQTAATAGVSYFVLAGDTTYPDGFVTVDARVTKGMVGSLTSNKPTITFDAAAIQFDNIDDVEDAWTNLPTAFKPTT